MQNVVNIMNDGKKAPFWATWPCVFVHSVVHLFSSLAGFFRMVDSSEPLAPGLVEPDGTLRFLQPSPGTESADPFQMCPWTVHQNIPAVSSSVGTGPGSGHCRTSPGLSEHVALIYVTCDPNWPLFLGVLAETSPLASVHLFSGPKLSFITSGAGSAGAVPVWSRVTEHKLRIRNKEKEEDFVWTSKAYDS